MKKSSVVAVKVKDSVFTYISTCCNVQANKPACMVEKGQRIGSYLGAKPTGEASLGTFRCSQCRKPCSVSRVKSQKEAVVA